MILGAPVVLILLMSTEFHSTDPRKTSFCIDSLARSQVAGLSLRERRETFRWHIEDLLMSTDLRLRLPRLLSPDTNVLCVKFILGEPKVFFVTNEFLELPASPFNDNRYSLRRSGLMGPSMMEAAMGNSVLGTAVMQESFHAPAITHHCRILTAPHQIPLAQKVAESVSKFSKCGIMGSKVLSELRVR